MGEMKALITYIFSQYFVDKRTLVWYNIPMNNYTHGRTCVYNPNCHIIWCTKYRRKVLSPAIAERLYVILRSIGGEKGFTVVSVKVGEADHVHCFVSAHPKPPVSEIVRHLKGVSSRILFSEFPEIYRRLWRGHLWNGSYFVEAIGSTSEDNILRYIERQRSS